MATATKLLTAEDLYRLPSDFYCELIDGVLIELSPPGNVHARVVTKVTVAMARAEAMGLGFGLSDAGYVLRRGPDTVRAPDVAFFRAGGMDVSELPRGFSDLVPDIVVEVVSTWDRPGEIQAKIRDWLESGVRLVIYVYPETRAVHMIRSLTDREELMVADTMTFGDLLPGFTCPVSDFFD